MIPCANQVNQYGGYTGMVPRDFYEMIEKMAKEFDVPENLIILGGDPLAVVHAQAPGRIDGTGIDCIVEGNHSLLHQNTQTVIQASRAGVNGWEPH